MLLLGVCWNQGEADTYYQFKYFVHKKSHGGFADYPASLYAAFEYHNIDEIINEIEQLNDLYPYHSPMSISYDQYSIRINISSYQLIDYDFALALQIEARLANKAVKLVNSFNYQNKKSKDYINYHFSQQSYSNNIQILISGGSLFIDKISKVESTIIEIDCNIKTTEKRAFIDTLKRIILQNNIHIFYYYEKNIEDRINLRLYLTNGRQGYNLSKPQFVDIKRFADLIDCLFFKFHVNSGLLGRWDYNPCNPKNKSTPTIELMTIDSVTNQFVD